MERDTPNSQGYKLESQIREAYGRLVYTFTCHNKLVNRLLKRDNTIKVAQIVLSALTTGSLLATIIRNEVFIGILGAILSICLLILNAYVKDFDLVKFAQSHQKAADELWVIREDYVSLLTDFESLELQEVIERRNNLLERTADVYSQSPRTDAKSYKEAQKALKTEEEQTFSEREIDVMLPNSLRREKN